MNEFAKLLYELRKNKHLTQAELAEKIGVSNKTISKWENGETYPETTQLIAISNLFEITIDELLKGKIKEKNLEPPKVVEDIEFQKLDKKIEPSPLTKKMAIQIIVELALIFVDLIILVTCMAFDVPYQIYVSVIIATIALACSIFLDMSIIKALEKNGLNSGKKYIHFISAGVFLTIFSPIIIVCLHEFVSFGIYLPIFFILLATALTLLIYGEIMYDSFERELGIKDPNHSTNFFDSVSGIILISATAIFILIGLMFGLWHPAWIIFPISGIVITILNSFKHIK